MRKSLLILTVLLVFTVFGCSEERKVDTSTDSVPVENDDIKLEENSFNVVIGNITYTAALDDNETARAFLNLLPLNAQMKELNGNEKYYDLSVTLPTTEEEVSEIHAGDIMLYNDNCIVLFYKDFTTSYKYSPIGHIEDPKGLEEALGDGDVEVEFN